MKLKISALAILFSLINAPVIAAPVVYIDFDGDGLQDTSTSVALGSSVNASLYVSNIDLTDGGLISWGTELSFSSSLLSASSYSIDSLWPLAGANNGINNSTGTVDLLASSFAAHTGTIKLADISFDTLIAGSSILSLDQFNPTSSTFTGFAAANGVDYDALIDFSLASATINVSAVPVPASIVLFLSGIIGLTGFLRKSKKSQI